MTNANPSDLQMNQQAKQKQSHVVLGRIFQLHMSFSILGRLLQLHMPFSNPGNSFTARPDASLCGAQGWV